MNKVKIRCSVCGKSFKSPSAKKTICPNCDANMKRAKHQAAAPATPQPVVTSSNVDVRAALRAAQENQGQFGAYRPPAPPPAIESPATVRAQQGHPGHAARAGAGAPAAAQRPARPTFKPGGKPRGPRAEEKPRTPRPPRERKPRAQTKPFEPTAEQITAIRQRYLELAHPEFDGIRHQIATEMGIPLRAVKDVVKQVRSEQEIPSWWDSNGNLPTPEQIDQIRALYMPHLPAPDVGIHKQIAASLKLSNTSVYQAIGAIRAELELPRYTPRDEEHTANGTGPEPTMGEEQPLETATSE